MWTCPKCAEKVEGAFDVCWRCGTSSEGVEDPDFVRADEAEPIPNRSEVLGDDTLVQGIEYLDVDPLDEFAEAPPKLDLVECYWAKNAFEAQFLAQQLTERGIPAVSDSDSLRAGLSTAGFGVPYFSPRVRVRGEDLARARQWLAMYESRRRDDEETGE